MCQQWALKSETKHGMLTKIHFLRTLIIVERVRIYDLMQNQIRICAIKNPMNLKSHHSYCFSSGIFVPTFQRLLLRLTISNQSESAYIND